MLRPAVACIGSAAGRMMRALATFARNRAPEFTPREGTQLCGHRASWGATYEVAQTAQTA
jgi:hypothetical protein